MKRKANRRQTQTGAALRTLLVGCGLLGILAFFWLVRDWSEVPTRLDDGEPRVAQESTPPAPDPALPTPEDSLTRIGTGAVAGHACVPGDPQPAEAAAPLIAVSAGGNAIVQGESTPDASHNTDFGTVLQGNIWVLRSFTIRNQGDAPLQLGPVRVPEGFALEGFGSLSNTMATSLAPGSSTQLWVALSTQVAGTKTGEILIGSNDEHANPYRFAVTGTVTPAPLIAVDIFGLPVPNGDTVPRLFLAGSSGTFVGGTDFGGVAQGGMPIVRTYTIRNLGGSILALGAVHLPDGFSLVRAPPNELAPGESTNFSLQLDSRVPGPKAGAVTIEHNGAHAANPFAFRIQGRVTETLSPAIAVFGNGIGIARDDATPRRDDHTDFYRVAQGAAPLAADFLVTNIGGTPLSLGTIFVPAGFTLIDPPAHTIEPQESTRFRIQLDSATPGIQEGWIRIEMGDQQTFAFSVRGLVTGPPAIAVLGNETSIAANDTTPSVADHTDFGGASLCSTAAPRIFRVHNGGDSPLTIAEVIVPEGFLLVDPPSASVIADASTSFAVRLDTASEGRKSGNIQIFSNDGSASPFTFAIQGVVTEPVPILRVVAGGAAIASGRTTIPANAHFGNNVPLGSAPVERQFTIENAGGLPLHLGTPSLPEGFTLRSAPANLLAPGTSTHFTVQLDTDVLGLKSGEIRIASNDSSANPFTFPIRGTVTSPAPAVVPALGVVGNGRNIVNGRATTSTNDHTEFGSAFQTAVPIVRTFTIRNRSAAPVTVDSVTVPAGFLLVGEPLRILAPDESTFLEVALDTDGRSGTYQGEIQIVYNGQDPFGFAIRGMVLDPGPMLTVLGGEMPIPDGSRNSSEAGSYTNFGNLVGTAAVRGGAAILRTFTVRNDGVLPLTLGAIRVPAGFTLVTEPAGMLAPGASATFQVQLDTATVGNKTGVLTIDNSGSQNPYSFGIAGWVMQAEPAPIITVLSSDGTVIAPGCCGVTFESQPYADFCTVVQGRLPTVYSYTIRNDGGAPLIVSSVQVPAGFTLIGAPAGSVAPGQATTFQVRLDTTTWGTKSGSLNILSNAINPGLIASNEQRLFRFTIRGTIEPVPMARLFGNMLLIANGDATPDLADHTDFGTVSPGSGPVLRTFAITNSSGGTWALDVQLPDGFTLASPAAGTLGPGATTSFQVRMDPAALGAREGTVRVTLRSPVRFADDTFGLNFCERPGPTTERAESDGENEPLDLPTPRTVPRPTPERFEAEFTFAIGGTVAEPVPAAAITVLGNGVRIGGNGRLVLPSVGDHTLFGTVARGATAIRTFTIRNDGTAALAIGQVSVPEGFVLLVLPVGLLSPGQSTTFAVALDTATLGDKVGQVRIANSDPGQDPFAFLIRGLVEPPAPTPLAVFGNGIEIAADDATPDPGDHTDFGSVNRGSTAIRTFMVTNTSDSPLGLGTVTLPEGFTLVAPLLGGILPPGAPAWIRLQLDTAAAGTRAGQVRIEFANANQSPFVFAIQGVVLP